MQTNNSLTMEMKLYMNEKQVNSPHFDRFE